MKSEETKHSPVGASSMHRWSHCPGSVRMSKGIKSTESKYAAEGTKAHEIAAFFLQNETWPFDADPEMIDNVQIYTDAVLQDKRKLNKQINGNLFLVEHGFALTTIHPDAFGTADCVIYNAETKILIVYDLKYGAGIGVEATDNEQLMYYGLGALLSANVPCEKVILKIAQPRYAHEEGAIRSWEFQSIDLIDFQERLRDAIERTEDPIAPIIPNKDWCRFCPALPICPAIKEEANVVAKTIFSNVEAYDPQLLADTLDKLPMVEEFAKAVREFAYQEAMKGRLPPGYKLVQKRATRKWNPQFEMGKVISKIAESTEQMNECYTPPTPPELKSPAQVEKILGKKAVEKYVIAESSGYKLAHVSEPGEAIALDAKSIFGELAEGAQ